MVRTADLLLLKEPTFFALKLAEEVLAPKDVPFEVRRGFVGTSDLCFGDGGAVKFDVLRKGAVFFFLLKNVSLTASISTPAPVTPFSSSPSESDTRMGLGIEIGKFPVAFATGCTTVLEPPTFFFLATGWSRAFFLALVRELARELASPLEEVMTSTLRYGGLLLVFTEWVLGNSRLLRTILYV